MLWALGLPETVAAWPLPAYMEPAVPPVLVAEGSLKAEPGADIELPGWLPNVSQLWFGCPVWDGPRVESLFCGEAAGPAGVDGAGLHRGALRAFEMGGRVETLRNVGARPRNGRRNASALRNAKQTR